MPPAEQLEETTEMCMYNVVEEYSAEPEIQEPLPEWTDWYGPELSSALEIDVHLAQSCAPTRWVVLWPAVRRAFFIGSGGMALSAATASVASDRMREHWNSALAGRAFFPGFTGVSHFTCDIRWAAGAEKLTVNMHAVHNFTVVMS